VDIRFGADGQGVGKVAPASQVAYNKETRLFEVQDFATQPVRLTNVHTEMP
jgi:hypothetical protein